MNVLLDALAAYRLQRLMGEDTITDPARSRLYLWTYDRPVPSRVGTFVTEMLGCVHCRTVWAAMLIVAFRRVPGGRVLRDVLAVAGAASLVSSSTRSRLPTNHGE